jgi:molybdenum cofactor cytidylyltransferase
MNSDQITACTGQPIQSPLVALILAAGYSRRFGKRDKRAAHVTSNQSLLATSYTNASAFFKFCRVIIREHDDLNTLGLPVDTPIYRAPHAPQGQGSTIADGFTAILHDSSLNDVNAAAIWLGDIPYIAAATLAQLACRANANNIVRPTWSGQVGHPVIFGRTFWPKLAELSGTGGAAELIRQHLHCYHEIAVNDAGVCHDIDTPAQLGNALMQSRNNT